MRIRLHFEEHSHQDRGNESHKIYIYILLFVDLPTYLSQSVCVCACLCVLFLCSVYPPDRFHMSMMEIYNETIFDLLRADGSCKTSLEIRQRAGGGTGVPGLTEVLLLIITLYNSNNISLELYKYRTHVL